MLSYLKLKNFKSFKDITLDLRVAHGIPKKIAFIYGENGAGKSNLMSAMLFLGNTVETLARQKNIQQPDFDLSILKEIDINTLSEIEILGKKLFEYFIENNTDILSRLIKSSKSIGRKEPMSIEVGFYLDEKSGVYFLEFDDEKVISEKLTFCIKERNGILYSIQQDRIFLSPSIFLDSAYNTELLDTIHKFWGKHTFMSILFYERKTKNTEYIDTRIKNNIFKVLEWLYDSSVLCQGSIGHSGRVAIAFPFLQHLEKGKINPRNLKDLKVFEKALNTFFTSLYSDIKNVYYKIDSYQYELTFKKQISDKIMDIPVSLESTGTKKLLTIFPSIFSAIDEKTVLIDEIDTGIHDLMMCGIVEHLQESLKGQFIATTHNTLLMEKLPNDNVYIISINAKGEKEIVCVSEYGFRTQKTNNMQKKYLNGDYGGIPDISFLDLKEIVREMKIKYS